MATNSEMEYDLKMRDLKLEEKQKELDQALRERDDFKKRHTKQYLHHRENKDESTRNDRIKVISEDWVFSDEWKKTDDFSEIQKKTVFNSENSETSFENKSPNSQNSVGQESRTKGLGNKGGKLCFVCYSPNHLIKNCNLHERTFKQTQTHKPKGTQGSRDTRPVWNNIKRVNHSNFSGNSRYPHQRRSFIPSAVLTREGLKSTARPSKTQTVPSKSTANVFYQGQLTRRGQHAVLSQSTGRPYYPRLDNIRPRTSSFSPSSRSSTTRTSYRPHRPKKIVKSIWVKKGSTVGSQAVLPQKFVDEDLVILRAPRKNDVYSLDLKNIIPSGGVTLFGLQRQQRMKLSYGTKIWGISDRGVENRLRHKVKPSAQTMHSEERTATKEIPLSSEAQALHDELMSLMHQESLAKAHNDAQRIAFEEEKRK
ncbi:hypothetical protein Tco_1154872 [Tanacetum coccineum]